MGTSVLFVVAARQASASFLTDELDRSAQGFLRQRIEGASQDVSRVVGGFWESVTVELSDEHRGGTGGSQQRLALGQQRLDFGAQDGHCLVGFGVRHGVLPDCIELAPTIMRAA